MASQRSRNFRGHFKAKEGVDRHLEGQGRGEEALGGLGEVWKSVGRGKRPKKGLPLAYWENGGEV